MIKGCKRIGIPYDKCDNPGTNKEHEIPSISEINNKALDLQLYLEIVDNIIDGSLTIDDSHLSCCLLSWPFRITSLRLFNNNIVQNCFTHY